MALGHVLQNIERFKSVRNVTRKTRDDNLGVLLCGEVNEFLDDHGRAVVEVRGFREIEDDDIVVLDVHADHRDQPVGGGDGETPPERYQTGMRRIWVNRGAPFLGEDHPVKQRHRDYAVKFQVFQLPRVGHPRRDQPDRHGGYQIDEHRQAQGRQHDKEVFPRDAVGSAEKMPVDDVPADFHQDPGKSGEWDRFDVPAQAQDQRQQEQGTHGARNPGQPACVDVGHGANCGPGAGQRSEHSRDHVADALTHQFPVRVVLGTGQRVGDQRGQQAVHGSEQGQNDRRFHGL